MTTELTAIQGFQELLATDKVQKGFGAVLPDDVPLEKFTAVVIRAVQEDPDILQADRVSLLLACQDAAKDGLIPDKREGALVVRNVKVNDQWVKKVTWQVMIAGLRKNLAKAGFDIRAEVIFENDIFDQELGDAPGITHKPTALGEPRGKVIGAYAIATNLLTGEKYREVMSYAELEEVRAIAQTDYIWKKNTNEMYRKTVARRLCKYLPISGDEERFNDMLRRDNEHFDLGEPTGPTEAAKEVQKATRKPSKKTASKKAALPKVKAPPKVVEDTKAPPAPVKPDPETVKQDNEMPVDDPNDPGF